MEVRQVGKSGGTRYVRNRPRRFLVGPEQASGMGQLLFELERRECGATLLEQPLHGPGRYAMARSHLGNRYFLVPDSGDDVTLYRVKPRGAHPPRSVNAAPLPPRPATIAIRSCTCEPTTLRAGLRSEASPPDIPLT